MKRILSIFIFLLFFTLNSVFAVDMRIVQVDGMLYSEADKNSAIRLEKFVQDVNKLQNIDFVVFTGNNISKPNKTNLESFLVKVKKLKVPYYLVLGNKDVNKQKGLSKKQYTECLQKKVRLYKKIASPNYTFIKKGIVFIVVDGSKEVIPSSMGYYKSNVLDWLNEQLILYKDKKVVILQHFPIVPPAKRESHYTFNADEYLELLSQHGNVKAVISGHFNSNNEKVCNGVLHISTANAPQYRIIDILDIETESPVFWSTIKD